MGIVRNMKELVLTQQIKELNTPTFLVDESRLLHNLHILNEVKERTGCKILLAQKAFSMFSVYPLFSEYLDGSCASGLYEARLGHEYFKGETHVYSPAYREDTFRELLHYVDDVIFNSKAQLEKYHTIIQEYNQKLSARKNETEQIFEEHVHHLFYDLEEELNGEHSISIGLRINPEHSTQDGHAIYDPCSPGSRLGMTISEFEKLSKEQIASLDGLHFHTLCEQNSDDLETTVQEVEEKFGSYLHNLKWLNLGGGHHITREDYDVDRLVRIVNHLQNTYHVQAYLEPGEAVVLNAGYLLTRVLDIVDNNGMKIAILDTSAACHMPDVIEMPYRPPLQGDFGEPKAYQTNMDSLEACNSEIIHQSDQSQIDPSGGQDDLKDEEGKLYAYRLAGPTCLAGDIIGDYTFANRLEVGDLLIFHDMALYTMVKTNTFNGMPLPDISYLKKDGTIEVRKLFRYEDFRDRLS